MTETALERFMKRMLEGIQTQRALLVRRVVVVLLLLYLAVMVDVESHVNGDLEHGFYFPHSGCDIFPIPFQAPHGEFLATIIVEFDTLDTCIYVVFVWRGVWVAWALLGFIYIIMPLVLWVFTTKRRPNSKTTQVRSDKGEKVGVLTGVVAVLSVYLSVATFNHYLNLENYRNPPLIVVSGLSIVVICVLLIEVLIVMKRRNIMKSGNKTQG